ncbi:MAG: hypothetical protein ACKO3F_10500 [Cyanobium sp.]
MPWLRWAVQSSQPDRDAGGGEADAAGRNRRPGNPRPAATDSQPTHDNLAGLAWHIRAITALAIAFVVVGALIRLGGLG